MRHRRLRGQGRGLSPLPPPRPTPKRLRLVVGPAEAGLTTSAFLQRRGGLSQERIDALRQAGGLFIDKRRASKADETLRVGMELVAHLSERGREPTAARALDLDRVLFLDDQLIVVDKPPQLAAQGTASNVTGGLDAAVQALLRGRGEKNLFVGLVHRLDLETSGVTVFGRTPQAVTSLTAQFRERRVEKVYRALVAGSPNSEVFEIDQPLAADVNRPGIQRISPQGRPAKTTFTVLRRLDGQGISAALLEARPHTGRTHQIRVHAAHAGLPLLGDRRYGGPSFVTAGTGARAESPRVALHALSLDFTHPNGRAMTLSAAWPEDLALLETSLGRIAAAP